MDGIIIVNIPFPRLHCMADLDEELADPPTHTHSTPMT